MYLLVFSEVDLHVQQLNFLMRGLEGVHLLIFNGPVDQKLLARRDDVIEVIVVHCSYFSAVLVC